MVQDSLIALSIIIVNYNGTKMLRDCLASVMQYTQNVKYEIIVVDNNSTDNFSSLIVEFPNVLFICNNENLGFARANNIAVKKAKGEFCLLLNNDTLLIENSIEQVLEFIKELEIEAFVGCKLLNRDGSLQLSHNKFPTVFNLIGTFFFLDRLFPFIKQFSKTVPIPNDNQAFETEFIIGAFILCRTAHFNELGGFDERFYFYSEDIDLCQRHRLSGGKVYFYPKTAIFHWGGATTENLPFFKAINYAKATIQIYQKYFHSCSFVLVLVAYYISLLIRIPIFSLAYFFTFKKMLRNKLLVTLAQLVIYPKNLFH
ncbi:MAG: glycosyltransferase family 2 protein [Ignavibacteriales bacterium]|nr:glycosyltransferase family 2 protein [Ignavibacteriales bacterium]